MMSQHTSHPRSSSTALLWRWFGPPTSLHITEELLIKDSPAESELCDTAEGRKLPFSQPHHILHKHHQEHSSQLHHYLTRQLQRILPQATAEGSEHYWGLTRHYKRVEYILWFTVMFWLMVCSGAQNRDVQLLCNLWNPQNSLTNSYKQLEACYFCAHRKWNIFIDSFLRSNCPDQLNCHLSDIFSDTVTFFTLLHSKMEILLYGTLTEIWLGMQDRFKTF